MPSHSLQLAVAYIKFPCHHVTLFIPYACFILTFIVRTAFLFNNKIIRIIIITIKTLFSHIKKRQGSQEYSNKTFSKNAKKYSKTQNSAYKTHKNAKIRLNTASVLKYTSKQVKNRMRCYKSKI